MLKQHKSKLILSSLLILLPIWAGLLLWDQLPDVMATHWGMDSKPDGMSSKAFAVFGTPLLLLVMHWFCLWITTKDPRQKNQTQKAIGMIFWIMPLISLFSSAVLYGTALGGTVNVGSVVFGMLGLMFIGIGNYLPKTKQNYTLGIKVTWALHNEENWNATHRFAGKLWVAGGTAILLLMFFPIEKAYVLEMVVMFVITLVPVLYSYLYYKKQCARGEGYSLYNKPMDKTTKAIYRGFLVFGIILLIILAVIMFTGKISFHYADTSFTIDPSYYVDLTVKYDAIDSIELRNEPVPGTREYGFGSARLLLGTFRNDEFGLYTRYTYTTSECAVILTSGKKTLVLAGKTPEETAAIYETLLTHISE